ncbi:MAG: hypothetical protein KC415_17450 [Anaerolineales bacterium]|nr:hypothetical protein [Anaerolineales bacterium]MCB8991690.1 hypothetical protein [Ardenticatenaceae bacterium]MCB9005546.1 hypothetical protein [Ardenticatenaceae bacterium]
MPSQQKELLIDGAYAAPEMGQIALGYIPQEQQDKWFIYFDGQWLHFHRSWTGSCIFQMRLLREEGHYRADKLLVNQDPAQYKMDDDQYNLSLAAYLVDHLLLRRFAQMPLPGNMSEQDQQRHQQHVMGQKGGNGRSIPLNLLPGNEK